MAKKTRGARIVKTKRNAAKVKGGKGHVKNRAAGKRIMRT